MGKSLALSVLFALTLLGSTPDRAHAQLVPAKPTSVVQLTSAYGGACGGMGLGELVDTRVVDYGGAGGVGAVGFAIPAGQVFVMTKAELRLFNAGQPQIVRLLNQSGGGGGIEYGLAPVTPDSAGHARATFSFPTGVVIRNLTNFCADHYPTTDYIFGTTGHIQGVVHGFLAPDK